MTGKDPIEALLQVAKDQAPPPPSAGLMARVLADAAAMAPAPKIQVPPKPRFWARLLSPIGGVGGALVLASCAAIGVFMGADYADELLAIPGMESVLAGLVDSTDSTTPFETLSLLMTEG